jgi:prolyl oligopeptidase
MRSLISLWTLALLLVSTSTALAEDPYLWLEEVEGEKALQWVQERSAADTAELESTPEFPVIHEKLLEIYNSADKIPFPGISGDWVYNFWQDAEHVRGIWRRTTLEDYPNKTPNWETVLDLDALSEAEDENWVWKGASFLPPEYRLCMLTLSRGGGDASVRREFDTTTGTFVEDGFMVPEAKARVAWKDEDTLWIGTDFGEGTMTTSGYPRITKEWKRGTPLDEAVTVFEGEVEDVSVSAYSDFTPERRYDIVSRTPAFFKGTYYINTDDGLVQIEIPEDANMYGFFKERMLVHLRSDWEAGGHTYPADALLAIDFDSFMQGDRAFDVLFDPSERVSFGRLNTTRDHLIYSTLDNVRGKLYRAIPDEDGWSMKEIPVPGLGTVGLGSASDNDNRFFFTYTDFVTPSSLYLVQANQESQQVKTTPEWFDATGMTVAQHEATSKDGTKIPYFIVMPDGFEANGVNPTMLYGYGGFEISMRPSYSGTVGSSWVERGGVYVLANIRGGGEFGPKWHEAAVKENHQRNFDDFTAVAEDLIARNITSPAQLGIVGGSQGGLLVGGSFVQRPELFGAVVCQVPLLDMKRYNKLLAGASWMAEYGNPDTEDWDNYMKFWSPYQNLDAEKEYPRVFFTTSTRDDRVHPGHARKMVAKMTDMGKPVYYYENTEGGHSAAANLSQRAYMWALTYSYLWKMLGSTSQP